ncbi:mitochondrial protein C2orf69 homolog isoform X2 [Tubulanus polymorphus]|uniref:mitochondrial protein C2orf69 homolog isoform X2 n=1 Tax=Tubulanus polymorphus TaxID=672921 RepID=UPI003DA571D4
MVNKINESGFSSLNCPSSSPCPCCLLTATKSSSLRQFWTALTSGSFRSKASFLTPRRATMTSVRLEQVEGLPGKFNDIIFHPPSSAHVAEQNVVYFGGDVQDYEENMLSHRDNHRYVARCLENVASRLSVRFPRANVWLVKPTRMHLKTFAVYSNFVESNAFGSPTHSDGQQSWKHLRRLLRNACVKTGAEFDPRLALVLCAFSKGCVVLNQLLYDLKSAKIEDKKLSEFVDATSEIYWLDGGHSGGGNTWVTDRDVLARVADIAGVRIHAHVSPYQVKDPMRGWIGKEQKKFVKVLRELGVNVTNAVHFGDEPGSIDNHFNVLDEF